MAKLRCIDHRRGVYMLRKELFEKLEMIVICLKDNSQPFGGIQLIFSGDFYQLRPVTQSYATNESLYCFASPMWASCVDVCVFFDENYRQCDTDLIDMFDDFRTSGCLSSHSHLIYSNLLTARYLLSPVQPAMNKHFLKINIITSCGLLRSKLSVRLFRRAI